MESTRPLIEAYLEESRDLLARLDVGRVEAVVDVLFEAWAAGRTVYLFGNGGSSSTAQHLAADLFKCTACPGKPRLRALCLNDNGPLLSALTNDDGWSEIYVEQLRTWWRAGDVAMGVSVHGGVGEDRAGPWSQNVLSALRYANEHGGKSLGLVGFDGGEMVRLCTAAIVVPAESTPHTEGLHVVLHHLIASVLKAKIEQA